MEPNAVISISGIKCDNTLCDYRDDSVSVESYPQWINKPCPKCGENLLTEEDFRNAEMLLSIGHLINSLPPERMAELNQALTEEDLEELMNNPLFKDAQGLDNLSGDGKVVISFDTHKEIKVSEIKKA